MDTKVLYVTAVLIAAVSGGYYYYSGKGNKLDANAAQSMTYSAEGIHVLQTDEKGDLHLRATVDHLEQDLKKETATLVNLNASMYENNQVNSTFYAKQANGYDDNEKVVLKGQVKATKLGEQGQMVFLTDELTSYPKRQVLETTHQVTVTAPNASFISQGLNANLSTGEYEFTHIRGKYVPN
ncbi:LPS export ABC transporter periplasmic protein LptC [Acinetobacter sichuanensis]|uniref:LPS export ABC transporter periplasmic protein LptC n=1 Tax=Acinetobacter sichuanensis TaxID=2136183 RepID=A0A371YLX8_9GAMM|nr:MULTISPECIES: LPS export ABC transporter periplasmic protein LptC [Acinetobacter]MDM1247862.1 LPS export ABC transporter periplasmic protein LptC [Acinetobacter sp. R933-2]MDM1765212.1 LPS export ABC transporter periplasmic protein LptC [Acinetobacter sp. 226-1]MDM1768717.1 LPS export ABC transporter periplasmic protein LptC [Acinetobacter sp. 226-4]MDQ9022230.1 LPS export ABC transporter periplasmic protein LptC [Acinetobacter sichuanensis]RFC82334.1 LPS export ABC transporter periplasmic 